MKETKIEIPADCEVDKIETQEGHIVVTFREKERKLPKSWEEFCEKFPFTGEEYFLKLGKALKLNCGGLYRAADTSTTTLNNRETAEAVLALCQLIQLRNAYNGDWVPDWGKNNSKYVIEFTKGKIETDTNMFFASTPLFFKTEELRDEFLRNFRPLIEKLKPLYGIMKGGEK